MGWKLAGFLLPLLLVISTKGTDLSRNDSSPEIRGPRANKRVIKLYSGTRPKPIVCEREGFQADPADCSIFHRCMRTGNGRYVSFRFQCGPGTIYDPDKEICSHPQNTKRLECGGRSSRLEISFDNEISREIPSPLSTNNPASREKYEFSTRRHDTSTVTSKYPWMSTRNQFLSPDGSTSNLFIDKHQENKSPKTSSIKRELTDSKYPVLSHSPSPHNLFSTTVKIDFQHSGSKSQSGDICTTNGFIGDSENCRKFYRCISNQRGGYLRYEFMCSDPTIWDDDKQACNHAWAVKRRRCGRGNYVNGETHQKIQDAPSEYTSTTQTTNLVTQSQLQINYGSKVTQIQTQISNGSVIQNQTQINYDSSLSSDKPEILQNQTQISHGDAVSQTQTQINYGNEAVQTQLQIDHSKDSSQAQTQISQSTSTSKTTPSNAQQSISTTASNNECTESGFMGDSEDCKKFYRCVDNGRGSFTRYEFSCGEGTIWDPKIEACNHAWAVKECGGKVSSQTTTQSSTIITHSTTQVSESLSTLSTMSTSQGYFSSVEPEPEDTNDISYGNQPISTTTKKAIEQVTDVNKEQQSTSNNECTSSGFMGDNKDCKKFYRCVDNGNRGYTRYEFTCGEGTVWDQKIEACNHAWAVEKCGNNNEVEKQTEKTTTTNGVQTTQAQTASQAPPQNDDYDTGYGQQPQHDEIVSSTSTTTTTMKSTTHQPSSTANSNVGNVCSSSGFMGDNNDCKKFYRCVDNGNGGYTRYEFTCGEGTVWDSKIQACNHAWAVEKCGGNTSEDINKEETTTHKEPEASSSTQSYEPDDNTDAGYGQENQASQSTSSTTSSITSSTSTTTSSSTHKACTTSGFMGDTLDCKKFYRCVDDGRGGYIRYEFACGEGTVWDQSIEACNHPWAVSGHCSTSGSYNDNSDTKPATSPSTSTVTEDEDQGYQKPVTDITSTSTSSQASSPTSSGSQCTQEGFYGDKNNCKNFYRCVDNGQGGFIKYHFTCGEGTVWNQDIQACDHESSNSQCKTQAPGSTTNKPSTEHDEMLTESTAKTTVSSSTSGDNTSYTSQKPQTSENQCKNEGFYGDPNDCKKFYRCVDDGKGSFTKYDFTCGDGTIWDQEILACNHENSNNKCSTGTMSSTSTTGVPIKEPVDSATTQESQSTQKPAVTKPESDQCTMAGFFANTNDCNKFYRCVDDGKGGFSKYDFACGEGTVWVQEIQACDYDNGISSCSNKDSSSKPTTASEEKSTTSPSSTSQATTESQSLDKEDDEYPSESSSKQPETDDKCTSEGFFGNKNDCTRFYRCVDNGQGGYTKYDFTCGEGTAWDSNIQTCNHINEVESCQNTNENSQSKPNENEGSPQTSESSTEETSSKPPSSSNDKCDQEGYFGNTQDCTKFYRCVDNGKGGYTKYDFTCGEGTIWDQDVTTCNHPQNVVNPSCQNGEDGQSSSDNSSSTESSMSSSTTSPSSEETTENGNQGSSNCSQESTSKKPENQKVKCEKAGFFADPDDCKKFYRCVDWDGDGKRFSIYHFDCGEGTIWDPQLETCNHEDSVYPPRDCSGSQSGNVSEETTSSTTAITTEKSTTTEQTTEMTQSTMEESTTQQSSSSEQTTQQTTTEKTTTQETTSPSEQTTTVQTTSTTQQSTSTEKTTTQQSTTSEKTTTQASTTEQSTTEQTTTSQQQTTQEIATSQQTTTSEPTTTEQTTTTDQTTTQQSTTSEQTTQAMTTSEMTTQSSSTEHTTTQQATTTEDNTTDSTTTEQQSSTSEQSSTTTEQSSEQSTTEHEKTTTEGSISTTESSESTTETNQGTTSTEATSSEKDCPESEDDQYLYVCPTSFRRHPKYCNMFYQCTEDNDSHDVKVTMFKCPNNTIYDESKTQCVDENKADKKCDGPKARGHRVKRLNYFKEPIEASRGKHTCSNVGNYPYETDNECSGIFLKCETTKSGKLRGYVYRCPDGYTYWSISKRCEKTNYMRDCKQSDRSWVDRWELPVEKKNIAK